MKDDRIESNLKIVKGGKNLRLNAKVIVLEGGEFESDDVEKVCSLLMYHHQVAAIPFTIDHGYSILVCDFEDLSTLSISIQRGTLGFKVTFKEKEQRILLAFENVVHRQHLANLYKRAFLISISKTRKYWTFDSPRIFYDRKPFKVDDDISVFRRFEISEVLLDEGIAISVDVGTTFFTNRSVDHFFKTNSEEKFKRLTSRQDEQKGTLLYKTPRNKYSKCYFVKYDKETTCGSTHAFEYDGKQYDSLFDYYQKINQNYEVDKDDAVAYVSFPNLDRSLPVAAKKLFVRVMNDMLPYSLSMLDKISPEERRGLLDSFWNQFGSHPFGASFKGLEFGGRYFRPFGKSGKLAMPDLIFNKRIILKSPAAQLRSTYQLNFKNRRKYLLDNGCFFTPLTVTREIFFVYPDFMHQEVIENFANDICDLASSLTEVDIEPIIEKYSNYREKLNSLGRQPGSMVVFVFKNVDPATYFTISHELRNWSIKRVTSSQLEKKHNSRESKRASWNSFIELNTFDILQQLGCVLWACPTLHYDIHLAIDVSEKFTHFCFSFYMRNEGMEKPIIKTDTFVKTNRKEKINRTVLENKLTNLFDDWNNDLISHKPVKMLVTRDGKICEGECEAIEAAVNSQISKRTLSASFEFDLIEYHKSSLKNIRLWEINDISVENVLEGTYFLMDQSNGILVPTGAATLNQGTAHPLLIRKVKGSTDLKVILKDIFALNQLNFSSPTVAQSYSLPIKRADDQLKDRRMQEVERIK